MSFVVFLGHICKSLPQTLQGTPFVTTGIYKTIAAALINAAAIVRYTECIMRSKASCQSLQALRGTVYRCRQGW